jgi:Rrf2 family protein
MRFSKTSEYAIRVLVTMVQEGPGPYSTYRLHKSLNIPYKYLGRLMKRLADAGFLDSVRGKAGGYHLRGDTTQIYLYQVVAAVEGLDDFDRCILGLPNCSDENPCSLHHQWGPHRDAIQTMLQSVSLAELAAKRGTRL